MATKATTEDINKIIGVTTQTVKQNDWGYAKKTWSKAVKDMFTAKKNSPEAGEYTQFMIEDFRRTLDMLEYSYKQASIGELSTSFLTEVNKMLKEHFSSPKDVYTLGIVRESVNVKQESNETLAKIVNELKYGAEYTPEVYSIDDNADILALTEQEPEFVEVVTDDDDDEEVELSFTIIEDE